MSDLPAINYQAISEKLVGQKADLEYAAIQWENLANTLKEERDAALLDRDTAITEVSRLREQLSSVELAPTPAETPDPTED